MMMDQYKEQYNRETEQIHAPAELIARTKAAMREEEKRISQMSAAQMTEGESKGIREDFGMPSASAGDRKYTKHSGIQKLGVSFVCGSGAVYFDVRIHDDERHQFPGYVHERSAYGSSYGSIGAARR